MRQTSERRRTDDWCYGTCQADLADGTCTRLIGHQGDHAALTVDQMVGEAHDAALFSEITRRAMAEEGARKAAILAAGCHHPERDQESMGVGLSDVHVVCRICGARFQRSAE